MLDAFAAAAAAMSALRLRYALFRQRHAPWRTLPRARTCADICRCHSVMRRHATRAAFARCCALHDDADAVFAAAARGRARWRVSHRCFTTSFAAAIRARCCLSPRRCLPCHASRRRAGSRRLRYIAATLQDDGDAGAAAARYDVAALMLSRVRLFDFDGDAGAGYCLYSRQEIGAKRRVAMMPPPALLSRQRHSACRSAR